LETYARLNSWIVAARAEVAGVSGGFEDVDGLAGEVPDPETVRSAGLRSIALRRAKVFSMGLKSGLQGGTSSRDAPAAAINSRSGSAAARQVVHDHDAAVPELGH